MSAALFASLRAFNEAMRAGSIRGASDNLNLAPSSVSRQIQLLEHQMGTALLDRSASGVVPTHAGKLVADFARTVLFDFDSLRSDINDRRGIRRGFVRIAAVESTISESAVAAIAAFRLRFPEVSFQLRMLPAGRVIEAVKMGEVDVGVTFCAPPDTSLTLLARFLEPVVLAVSPHHEWAHRKSISLPDLAKIPLAMPEPSFGVRRMFDAAAQAAGVELVPAMGSDSFEALRGFARMGIGGSVLPRLSIEAERKTGILVSLRIDEASLNCTTADVIVLKSRRPNRLLKLFFEELQRVVNPAP